MTKTFLRTAFLWLILAANAQAYVDPGSGMLLWQGLVALVGAILIFFRNPFQVIKSWIDRIRGK
jgi:hypothetical protein